MIKKPHLPETEAESKPKKILQRDRFQGETQDETRLKNKMKQLKRTPSQLNWGDSGPLQLISSFHVSTMTTLWEKVNEWPTELEVKLQKIQEFSKDSQALEF